MFESTLEKKLTAIFGVEKVTYSAPGDSREQRVLFVELEDSANSFKDGRMVARVRGKAVMFGQNDQIPFGFFSKRIAQHPALTKDLFFFDIEQNSRTYQNLVERSFSFVYFFDGQYDPAVGTISTVTLTTET